MSKKKGAGLVIVTEFPDATCPDEKNPCRILGVLCQVRAKWNQEKGKPESFPGCLQVACHGGLKEGEDFYDAVIRESCEELGEKFTKACQKDVKLIELIHKNDDNKEVVTFGAYVPYERIQMIQAGKDVGCLKYLSSTQVNEIIEITPEMKVSGPPEGKNAMFADEIEALKEGLKHLTK